MDSPRAVCADPERLRALHQHALLDSPREPEFDDLCRLAADLYDAPIGLITIVDCDRLWFKSAWGIDWCEAPLEASACAYAICHREGLVVPDARAHPHFRHLACVAGEPHIRFYAGAVIRTPEGQPLGTICALDYAPQEPDPARFAALGRLARQAMSLLTLRRALHVAREMATAAAANPPARADADAALQARAEFQRRVFESTDDWVEILDLEGRLISTSYPGEDRDEMHDAIAGADWARCWQAVSGAAVRAALGEARVGRVGRFEGRLAEPDGAESWWEVVLTAMRGKGGAPEQLLAVSRNVTARHLMAVQLAESEVRYRALSEISPQAVWMADPDGWISYVNEYWLRLTGLSLGDALGDGWLDVVHPDHRERVSAEFRRHLASGEAYENEIPFRCAGDGEYRWFLNCAKPSRGADGRIRGWLGVSLDIHERKLAQERLTASEQHARRVLDGLPLHIGVLSPDGALLEVNRPVAEVFGAAHAGMLGAVFSETPYCRAKPELQRKLRAAVASARAGLPSRFDLEGERAAGHRVTFDISIVPLLDDAGCVTHLLACALDVTDRTRVQHALVGSEERSRTFIQATSDTVWWSSATGALVAPQAGWEAFTGQRWEEYRGFGWAAVIHPEDREPLRERWTECVVAKTPFFSEHRVRRADGEERLVSARVIPVRDERGELREWVGAYTDITEHRRVEAELRQALELAQRASAAKDDFIAQLSHELRTPLTPVLMSVSSMLEQRELEPALREDLQLILRNVRLEARLIDDLLDVTRIAHGKLELHLQRCSIHGLVEQALQVCDGALGARQIHVVLRAEAGEHSVHADPTRLQQVLWNLISNAVKFTPVGGRIEIVSSNPAPGIVRVSVRDNGIGIAPERIPALFDAFEQGDALVTRQFGGLGLGLAICKGIVERHGGQIAAQSEGPGCGTEFAVEIATLAPAETEAAPLTRVSRELGEGERDCGIGRLRILFVEDHENTAEVLGRLLRRAGHEVVHGATLEEGKRLGSTGGYDLVISDLGLPDGTGLELMAFLREGHPQLPGIALSGFGTQADMLASRAVGFANHLVKPVEWRHLEETIRDVVQAAKGAK